MPCYQYDLNTEIRLQNHPFELNKIEKSEETKFNELLAIPENRLIDLLDQFFPPRFWMRNGRPFFYPTLPVKWRKRALEVIQKALQDGKFPIDTNDNGLQLKSVDLLVKKKYSNTIPIQWSYAVFEYDKEGRAIVEPSNILSSTVDTRLFIEFLIEHKIFPFELLHFKIVHNIFMEWNKKRLKNLRDDLKKGEGWPLIDSISLLSGFYMLNSWVSDQFIINGFVSYFPLNNQPLRWSHEEEDNTTESSEFERKKGLIDSGKLPLDIIEKGEKWDDTLKQVQVAMQLKRIKHTGGDCVNRSDVRVDEISLIQWAEKKGITDAIRDLESLSNNAPNSNQIDGDDNKNISASSTLIDEKNTVHSNLCKNLNSIFEENKLGRNKRRMKALAIKLILETIKEIYTTFDRFNMPGVVSEFYDFCQILAPKIFPKTHNQNNYTREKTTFHECCKAKKMRWATSPFCSWKEMSNKRDPDFWNLLKQKLMK